MGGKNGLVMEGLGRHRMFLVKGDLVGQNSWDVQNRDNLGDKRELRGNGGGDSPKTPPGGVWAGVLESRGHLGAVPWDGLGPKNSMGAGGDFPSTKIIKRSLPFFTWIAEPWPWRWTTAGCRGEHRD